MKKQISLFLFTLLFLLSFCSCDLTQKEQFSSETKTIGEILLPPNTLALFKFSTINSAQKAYYTNLKETLFQQQIHNFIQQLNEKLLFLDLEYENDLKPLLDQKTETLLAFAPNPEAVEPIFYLIQKIEDPILFENFKNKLAQNKYVTTIPEGLQIDLPKHNRQYLGQKNGLAFVVDNKTAFLDVFTRNPVNSLVYNKQYQQTRENVANEFLSLLYLNLNQLNQTWQQFLQTNSSGAILTQDTATNWLNLFSHFGITLTLDEYNLIFNSFLQGNKETLIQQNSQFNQTPNHINYLTKYLPGQDLLLYIEGFNLKNKILKLQTSTNSGFTATKKQLETNFGINFEKDILSWLDLGFAFSLHKNENALPFLTIAFDVSNNSPKAMEILNTFDGFISIAKLSLKDYAPAIAKSIIQIEAENFHKIKILQENLPLEIQEKAALITQLLSETQLIYGITKDNLLIFSTDPNFAQNYKNEVVSQNLDYKRIATQVENKNQGILFLTPKTFMQQITILTEIFEPYRSLSSFEFKKLELLNSLSQKVKALLTATTTQEYEIKNQTILNLNL